MGWGGASSLICQGPDTLATNNKASSFVNGSFQALEVSLQPTLSSLQRVAVGAATRSKGKYVLGGMNSVVKGRCDSRAYT